jgi:pantothenate kinase-related protein Tda10
MMTRFHHRRVPLLITIGGTGCCGRSTLAALLGEVLNLSHVVSSGAKLMIFDMFLGTFDGVLPIYGRKMGEIGVL